MSWRYKGGFIQAFFSPTQPGTLEPALFVWGGNAKGQLGDGTVVGKSSPVQLGTSLLWLNLSAGNYHTLATRNDGTLWSWGQNSNGQLGQNNTSYRSSPTQVGSLTGWSNVDAGEYNSIATRTNGTIWAWGANNNGQLGLRNTVNASSPVQIGAQTNWLSASITGFSLALKTNGTIFSWGDNGNGQLGQNIANTINRSSPVQIGTLTTWLNSSAGNYHAAAIITGGTLWTWGQNSYGQLGQNISYLTARSSPVQVGALTTWSQVSCGQYHTAATTTDGTLWTWGRNFQGQLGQNISYLTTRSSPVQVGALTTWSAVSCGASFTAALKTDGTLWAWGDNTQGALGQRNTINTSSPVQVGTQTNWLKVSCGLYQILATRGV